MAGEIPVDERIEIVNHVFDCPECAWRWRLAKDLGAMQKPSWSRQVIDFVAADLRGLGHLVGRAGRRLLGLWRRGFVEAAPSRRFGIAAAIAAMLAIALVPAWIKLQESGSARIDSMRLVGSPPDPASGQVIAADIDQAAPQPRQRCVLRWKGPPGARYDLVIRTAALEPVHHEMGLEATEFLVPPDKLRDLEPGSTLRWQVTVSDSGRSPQAQTFSVVIE